MDDKKEKALEEEISRYLYMFRVEKNCREAGLFCSVCDKLEECKADARYQIKHVVKQVGWSN